MAACIAFLFAQHRFRRFHRVHPKVATAAPARWAVDPRQAARLHRRLARIGTTATALVDEHRPRGRLLGRRPELPPLARTAAELCDQAVALDRHLTHIGSLAPSACRQPLADLAGSVSELESATAQLVALAAQVSAPRTLASDDPTVTAIASQLDRLAQAHRELDAIDDSVGLTAVQRN